jgi:hypothetical protein
MAGLGTITLPTHTTVIHITRIRTRTTEAATTEVGTRTTKAGTEASTTLLASRILAPATSLKWECLACGHDELIPVPCHVCDARERRWWFGQMGGGLDALLTFQANGLGTPDRRRRLCVPNSSGMMLEADR